MHVGYNFLHKIKWGDREVGQARSNSRAANDRGGVLSLTARNGHLVVQAGQEGGSVAIRHLSVLASIEIPLILGVGVSGKA